MIKGVAMIRLSKRSKIPPCPGNKVPESFTLILLFKSDSTKSPNVPITINMLATTIQSVNEMEVYHPEIIKTMP